MFLSIFISLASCKNDDNISENNNSILGNWKMVKYIVYNKEPPIITKGDIVWIFDNDSIKMINESPYSFASPKGTFLYTWVNNHEDIKVDLGYNMVYFKVNANNKSLHLTLTSGPEKPPVNNPIVIEFEK